MHNFLALLASLMLSIPAYSAGLGFNPFERNSPTSATGTAKPKPVSPATPASPASPVPKPSALPATPSKQEPQVQKPSNAQNKN